MSRASRRDNAGSTNWFGLVSNKNVAEHQQDYGIMGYIKLSMFFPWYLCMWGSWIHQLQGCFPWCIFSWSGEYTMPGLPSGFLHLGPENHPSWVETTLPTPMNGRVKLLIYWMVMSGQTIEVFMTWNSTKNQGEWPIQIDYTDLTATRLEWLAGVPKHFRTLQFSELSSSS